MKMSAKYFNRVYFIGLELYVEYVRNFSISEKLRPIFW